MPMFMPNLMAGVDESLFSEMWLRCLAVHSLKTVINMMLSKWKNQATYNPWRQSMLVWVWILALYFATEHHMYCNTADVLGWNHVFFVPSLWPTKAGLCLGMSPLLFRREDHIGVQKCLLHKHGPVERCRATGLWQASTCSRETVLLLEALRTPVITAGELAAEKWGYCEILRGWALHARMCHLHEPKLYCLTCAESRVGCLWDRVILSDTSAFSLANNGLVLVHGPWGEP
jgi:hypothetical protein